MTIAAYFQDVLSHRLACIYGQGSDRALNLLLKKIEAFVDADDACERASAATMTARWDQRDVVLITYGDQVTSLNEHENPLQTHLRFLTHWQLPKLINTIHFLPFFPYSSDDGFSVIDYRQVDPALGGWEDVHEIGKHCRLMFDFVVNHASQQSEWFQKFLDGIAPYDQFFIEVAPQTDVSCVTRPRSLPLLQEFDTKSGAKLIWTTFSRDQVDLNYASPELLAEVVEILLDYIRHGARIIRLDAIAYLWKELGKSCIHLPQTHEMVKLFRDIMNFAAPHVLLLTETNVPHNENVSYFGDGDEAHMVYQFSLPPLLLDAFINQDAEPLKRWLADLASPPAGTTYFNFTASHDGIGVRPLEGHVDSERLSRLMNRIQRNGGHVSTRCGPDGTDVPYELNISYIDALVDPDEADADQRMQLRRFLATQAVMMSLQGMPAIYFHSLVGTASDHEGVQRAGIARRINRRKYDIDTLNAVLETSNDFQRSVFEGMKRLLKVRIEQPAFHPDARQTYVESGEPGVLAFRRDSQDSTQRILVLANFDRQAVRYDVKRDFQDAVDLLDASDTTRPPGGRWALEPGQVRWLTSRN